MNRNAPVFIFRCNANETVGMGHLVRCRTLAKALADRGATCGMVGPEQRFKQTDDSALFSFWLSLSTDKPSAEDPQELIHLATKHNAKALILDDYRINQTYQQQLCQAGLKFLKFEETFPISPCATWILCASPHVEHPPPATCHDSDTVFLYGPRYTLLRQEFVSHAHSPAYRPQVQRILLTFGGGDDQGALKFALSTLLPTVAQEVTFVLVSGKANPYNSQINDLCNEFGNSRIEAHIDPDNIADIFAGCDLAVISGGISTFEVASCGLPMILLCTAENQRYQAQGWHEHKAAILVGNMIEKPTEVLVSVVTTLINSPNKRKAIGQRARSLVDGKGAARVADMLMAG